MVQLDTILEGMVQACNESTILPDEVTYSTVVLDSGGQHSNIRPPIIEFSVDSIDRDTSRNTEKVGVETNSNGTEVGYIYTQWFDAVVTAEILSVAGTKFNHRELEQNLRQALYRYDIHGLNEQLPDPNNPSSPLRDVNWISLDSIQPDRDFALSPSVRTRTATMDVGFTHEIRTSDYGIKYDEAEEIDLDISVVFESDSDDD